MRSSQQKNELLAKKSPNTKDQQTKTHNLSCSESQPNNSILVNAKKSPEINQAINRSTTLVKKVKENAFIIPRCKTINPELSISNINEEEDSNGKSESEETPKNDVSNLQNNKANALKHKSTRQVQEQLTAEENWEKARTIFNAMQRLTLLTRETQLYGCPVFENDTTAYAELLRSTDYSKANAIPRLPFLVFHPKNKILIYWDILILLEVLYSIFWSPILISFIKPEDSDMAKWTAIETIVDICFFFDFLLNYLIAFYNDNGTLITSHYEIFKRQFNYFILVDILSFFPLQFLSPLTGSLASSMMQVLRTPIRYAKLSSQRQGDLISSFFVNTLRVQSCI